MILLQEDAVSLLGRQGNFKVAMISIRGAVGISERSSGRRAQWKGGCLH